MGRLTPPTTREQLQADRTYYVRTDGSDSNTGLANTSGGAFLTIQKAINTVANLDIGTNNVTIQLGDGTYTAGATVSGPWLGTGTVTLLGNTGTPANVIINASGGTAVLVKNGGVLTVSGFEVRGNVGLHAQNGGIIIAVASMRFGAAVAYQAYASNGAISFNSAYTISGGAINHWAVDSAGKITATSLTITISGTPAFSGAFASASGPGSALAVFLNTFSGSATGSRYSASYGSFISVNGAGTSYLPGDSAGSGTNYGASPWGLYE